MESSATVVASVTVETESSTSGSIGRAGTVTSSGVNVASVLSSSCSVVTAAKLESVFPEVSIKLPSVEDATEEGVCGAVE